MSEKIKAELLALKTASQDGLLHVEEAEEWARGHPESALHKALEWDDLVAAREYRIDQIRRLVRVHIVSEDGIPQLVSLSFDRAKGGGYRGVDEVVKSRDLSAIMLADALAELERMQSRYARVKELTAVWEQVEAVKRRTRRRAPEPAQLTAG